MNLPKHVQKHIRDLERQRDLAIRALNEHVDTQTKSNFFYDSNECLGEDGVKGPIQKRMYIQAHRVSCISEGIEISVFVRDGSIEVTASAVDEEGDYISRNDVGIVPQSRGCIKFALLKG